MIKKIFAILIIMSIFVLGACVQNDPAPSGPIPTAIPLSTGKVNIEFQYDSLVEELLGPQPKTLTVEPFLSEKHGWVIGIDQYLYPSDVDLFLLRASVEDSTGESRYMIFGNCAVSFRGWGENKVKLYSITKCGTAEDLLIQVQVQMEYCYGESAENYSCTRYDGDSLLITAVEEESISFSISETVWPIHREIVEELLEHHDANVVLPEDIAPGHNYTLSFN